MSTVLEIERAIEQLPVPQQLEVGRWLDERRARLGASGSASVKGKGDGANGVATIRFPLSRGARTFGTEDVAKLEDEA